jgi:hypothetical protein
MISDHTTHLYFPGRLFQSHSQKGEKNQTDVSEGKSLFEIGVPGCRMILKK